MKRSPIVYILFFLSGITALVYEIVWTRMLTLVFGHTVFSVSVVLSAFMAGLGFGSYLWGYTIDQHARWMPGGEGAGRAPSAGEEAPTPLLIYGWIEIAIAVSCAVLSLIFANFSTFYSWLHLWLPESVAVQNVIKSVLSFLLIFVPTTFMGATLPIISRYYVTDDRKLGTQVGYLYAINTLGAALGCLLTGYFFMSTLGVLETVLFAAFVNLFIGVSAIRIYQDATGTSGIRFRIPRFVLPTFEWSASQKLWMGVSFVCGFTALAYEVLWTRLLVFTIASTVYSFSMMLAVFLFGIVLGSALAVPLLARAFNLRTILIWLQAGVGLYVIGSLFTMDQLLSAPWNSYNLQDPLAAFARYFKDSSALMLVPTLLLGMNLPILIKAASGDHEHVGRGTGQVYASNTFGAILGSLCAGFLLLPAFGTQESLMAVATLNLLLMVVLLWTGPYWTPGARRSVSLALAGVLLYINLAVPGNLLDRFFMRDSAGQRSLQKLLYFDEGLTATVAVFKDNYGVLDPEAKRLITNGISMSASNVIATRYMKLFAHVPILLSDQPDDVLVVCFGTGQTTGAAGIHPRVRTVDSLELSPSVVKAGRAFASENHNVLDNPKVNIILQDGRNYLLTTRKKYDVITSEPPPPRTAFTVNLYTRDYYELTRKHLKPGGIVAQWIPLHSQGPKEVGMHFRTFHSVFPYTMAWLSVANEILIIGSDRPIEIDFQKLKARMEEPVVRRALQDIAIENVYSFLGNIWFLEEQIEALGRGRQLITDNHPVIEFYLNLGNVIGLPGMEKLVFNRAPLKQVAERIAHWSGNDRRRLENYYRAMDLYQRGVMYNNRRQLLKAIALVEDDDLFRYHLQAGRTQVARLEQEVNRDPENVDALLNLGHAHYQVGAYEKSREILERVLALEPRQSFAHLYLGYDLMELGRYSQAKKYFESAAKIDPRHFRAVMQQVALINLLAEWQKDPENPSLTNSVAQLYNVLNDYDKSLEYSLKVLEKDPMNIRALQSVVFSYRGLGDPKEVLAYGVQYQTANPDDLHLKYLLAEIYTRTLRCGKAIPLLEKILKKDDSYRNARKYLKECRAESVVNPSA